MKKYRKPYRVRKKKSIFRNRFFWLGILILIIFGGFFYLICFSSFFQIKEIKISGNQKVPTADLQNIIQNRIEKKVLFFRSKGIFLADLNKINGAILEKFPQIAQANLDKKFPNTLLAQVEERKPIAIFCQGERYFFLDKEGIIFEEVSEVGIEYLKIKNLTLIEDLKLGEEVVKKEVLPKILEIESKLRENFKISAEEISILSEDRLNAKTLDGWEIYFNPQKDLNWQLTKLNAVLEEEIPLERRKDLEYIELRFGNFAPYKYKD